MCNPDCCCREAPTSSLINYLLVFIFINLVLSVVSIFIRAAKTERYDQALLYLEAINKGKLDLNLAIFGINNCARTGDFLDDNYYCSINGRRLKKPSESVSYQSLFKKWNKVELILSILRTIVTAIFLVFLYFVIKTKTENLDVKEQSQIKKYENSLNHSIICIIFLIVISGIWILIRALALTANDDIGLYEDGEQNAFEERIAINYILDIIEIVLYGISICFVIRIRRGLYKPPQPQITTVNQPPPTVYTHEPVNPPPPVNPPQPVFPLGPVYPQGHRLLPIEVQVSQTTIRRIQIIS